MSVITPADLQRLRTLFDPWNRAALEELRETMRKLSALFPSTTERDKRVDGVLDDLIDIVPKFVDAYQVMAKERDEAIVKLEHARNEHMATLQNTLTHLEREKLHHEQARKMFHDVDQLATKTAGLLAMANAELERLRPLRDALVKYLKYWYKADLLASWERYQQACKSGPSS